MQSSKVLLYIFVFFLATPLYAQQPFFTDDADITGHHLLHLELFNQFALLHDSAYPSLRQNALNVGLMYGLFKNVEVGVNTPLIAIFNDSSVSPDIAFGPGDTNLSVKMRLIPENVERRNLAISASVNFEIPTGNTNLKLGSGLEDFGINGILQKRLSNSVTLRINAGAIFSGNKLTGVIGIKKRGFVFTGGTSVVYNVNSELSIGAEIVGSVSDELELSKGLLLAQVGGHYLLKDGLTLDFGILGGKYTASPELGIQAGIAADF